MRRQGLKENRLIRILGWFVGLSWAAMMLQILLQCRPVQKNWQIKPYVGGKFCKQTSSSIPFQVNL